MVLGMGGSCFQKPCRREVKGWPSWRGERGAGGLVVFVKLIIKYSGTPYPANWIRDSSTWINPRAGKRVGSGHLENATVV